MKKQTAESSIVYIVKLSENITICEHINHCAKYKTIEL